MLHRAGVLPLSVQVVSRQRGPVVADHHPVGVQHGHDLEDVLFAEELGVLVVAGQEFNHAFHDEAGLGLPGVHAAGDEYAFSLCELLLGGREVCDYDEV